MAKYVMLEEFHLSLLVRPELPTRRVTAIRQVLGAKRFQTHLRLAVRKVLQQFAALQQVKLRLSR